MIVLIKIKYMKNTKFGKLRVVEFSHREKYRDYWLCRCDCGNTVVVCDNALKSGNTKSCGCLLKFQCSLNGKSLVKHGMSRTRFYGIWGGIKSRCYNKNHKDFKLYGGKGIKMSNNWLKFENFRDDMYKSYLEHCKKFSIKNTTIDRIDGHKDYYKINCRWATIQEQADNKCK